MTCQLLRKGRAAARVALTSACFGSFLLQPILAETFEKADEVLSIPSLPHLRIDTNKRHLDIDSMVCLHEGKLELIACTEGTKEHESLVAIEALPKHVHLMLTLLGTKNGHPPKREAIDESGERWRDVPARGQKVDVFLVYKDEGNREVEKRVQHFLQNEKGEPFPTSTFLFAGSVLRPMPEGPAVYLADHSGHLVTICSFGDELLSLPGIHSHANGLLEWEVNPDGLPAVGAKVVLRLRPHIERQRTAAPKEAAEENSAK